MISSQKCGSKSQGVFHMRWRMLAAHLSVCVRTNRLDRRYEFLLSPLFGGAEKSEEESEAPGGVK